VPQTAVRDETIFSLLTVKTSSLLGSSGIVLHPDFGIDKTNKTIRSAHKLASRCIIALSWITAFLGLQQMASQNYAVLALYGVPLLLLAPMVLL
jgi:hypothetical protein